MKKFLLRFCTVVLDICNDKYVRWPNDDERTEIVNNNVMELPFCIGIIDGSEIRLKYKPKFNHQMYWSRKRQYSIKMQLVCTPNLMIKHYSIGAYGSTHDSVMYHNSELYCSPNHYFTGNQYILGMYSIPFKLK